MSDSSEFDFERDAQSLIRRQWLGAGERLRVCAPVRKPIEFDGIPKPPPTPGQVARGTLRVLGWTLLWMLFFWILAILEANDVNYGGSRHRQRSIVIWGKGSESQAGRIVSSAMRSRGIWVLSDRRFAFLKVDAKSQGIQVETVAAAPATAWRYSGLVDRTKRGRLTGRYRVQGRYHRIVFPDGSGIDFAATTPEQ
ncbi:hypothetical protein [Glycomyces buryatensis]|uniref:Uncharacterized protein n=1 Tax=Glycomyces buryatensis TaxID=2570927 RepID=A0A4S8QBA4_9ACTN|nr:hypothetical protein [Glycomyces buryatensis]THV41628.1 hypothetical protein FAB82_11045 [Glycomyces buryatensis]